MWIKWGQAKGSKDIELRVVQTKEAIKESLARVAAPVKLNRTPDIQARVGDLEVWVYVASADVGPYDPYVICESGDNDKIIVIINMS